MLEPAGRQETHLMRRFICAYAGKMNFRYSLLEFDVASSAAQAWIAGIPFEEEDSGFAPEPSVACGLLARTTWSLA